MSDKKLFQLPTLSAGGGDLVYVARPDGSADGSASFTALAPVLTGVLSPSFAAAGHAHSISDISDAGALAAKDSVGDGDWAGAALAVTHGGTGATSASAARTALGLAIGGDVQGFNARLAEIAAASWAQGDILYFNGSNLVRLAAGASGNVLQTNGVGANPSWAAPSGGGVGLTVKDEGINLDTAVTSIEFVGNALTASNSAHAVTVTLNEATAAHYRSNTANKVLNTDKVWSAADTVALTDAATITVDLSTGINFSVTLGGNRILGAPSNTKNGQAGLIYISQDGTGSRTLAYNSAWKFASGGAPVLTTTANALDVLAYQVQGSSFIVASLMKDLK